MVSAKVAAQLRAMLTVTVEDGTGTQRPASKATGGRQDRDRPEGQRGRAAATPTTVRRLVRRHGAGGPPRLVILVMVDEPSTEHFGANVAAPAFARIADFAAHARHPSQRDPAWERQKRPRPEEDRHEPHSMAQGGRERSD